MKYPTISIIIATYNSAKTLTACLESIKRQDYPRKSIEIILADGGSVDDTIAIGHAFGAKILPVNSVHQGAEYNRAIGAHEATKELLLFIDHDNILPHARWLKAMVLPLVDDAQVVGVETLHYTYSANDSLLGRYFSLFGANDIFAFYLGKADRIAYFYDNPSRYGVFRKANVVDKGKYFVVDFDKNRIPTLGSNGFLVRKSILFRYAKTKPDEFFHIDVNVDLIRNGHNRYAFIVDTLHHKTDERGLGDYLRRRKLFMEKYHFGSGTKRRYSLYESGDLLPTIGFVLLSLTVVVPFFDAVRGFKKVHDPAWFINPVMCFCLVILYGFVIIERFILGYAKKLLGR